MSFVEKISSPVNLVRLIVYSTMSFLAGKLFYCQAFLRSDAETRYISDLRAYIYDTYELLQGHLPVPHFGVHAVAALLVKVFHLALPWALIVTGVLIIVFKIGTIEFYLNKFLLEKFPGWFYTVAATALTFVVAVYLPFFNKHPYLGQSSPNIWHSLTTIAVKPVALIVFFSVVEFLQDKKLHKSPKFYITTALMLVISTLLKPNFAMVFVPALGFYILLKHLKEFDYYWKAFLIVLPVIGLLFIQFLNNFIYGTHTVAKISIIFDGFKLWASYSPFVPISIVLAIAFPLAVMIFRFKDFWSSPAMLLVWIQLVVGTLQAGLLAETLKYRHGNFFWGYNIALHVVFIVMAVEFLKWLKTYPEAGSTEKNQMRICIVLFFAHLISGIYYFSKIYLGGFYD